MNTKEIGEIRRHLRRDRSNITAIYGCYVNDAHQIVSESRLSTGMMPENEGEKYFAILRRCLSGTQGKNLIDLTFQTAQVTEGAEHKLLMDLRKSKLEDEELRGQFFQKVMDSLDLEGSYLILLGCDTYDVPFKSKDGEGQADRSEESYTYLICAICPVKQPKPGLCYDPEKQEFHDGGLRSTV